MTAIYTMSYMTILVIIGIFIGTSSLSRKATTNKRSFSTRLYLNQIFNAYTKSFQESEYSSLALSNNPSELPNSFQDAVDRAAKISVTCFSYGITKCRIDFDTSVGDMTYTSLKNTLPMAKELVIQLADKMNIEQIKPKLNLENQENESINEASPLSVLDPVSNTVEVSSPTNINANVNMNKNKRDMAKDMLDEINKNVTNTIRYVI